MQYWPEFLSLAVIHFVSVIMPGPDFVVTVQQSLRNGRVHGIYTALGVGTGLGVHILYTLLGVGALMQTSPQMLIFAKIAGSIYLLYLAVGLIRSKEKLQLEYGGDKSSILFQSISKAFKVGFLTNAMNPKATLFFLAIVTNVVSHDTPAQVQALYGLWMCSITAIWFVCVSLLFSAQSTRAWFLNKMKVIEKVLGVLLIAFSLRLLIL